MYAGKVKWYNEIKGFGFIEMEDRNDVFIHRSGLSSSHSSLSEGQEVVFDIKQGDKGDMAYNLK